MEFTELVRRANMRIRHSLAGLEHYIMVAISGNNRINIRGVVDRRQATFDSVITSKHRRDVWVIRDCK